MIMELYAGRSPLVSELQNIFVVLRSEDIDAQEAEEYP